MNNIKGIRSKNWFQRISYLAIYFPFKWYLIAFAITLGIAYPLVIVQMQDEPSAFNDMLTLLIKVTTWFILPLLGIGLLTVLIPYLLALNAQRQSKLQVKIESPGEQPEGRHQQLNLVLHPLWQPLLGQLYFRFVYDNGEKLSPKFSLVRNENGLGFAGFKQEGWYRWPLPGIREYEVYKLVIYFEDIFHFFSPAISIPVHQSFFTRPGAVTPPENKVSPTKTEQEELRIEDWRKVQGEWLNYKHFESNDDVRRILWKVYARNKELVVRTPEIMDPFASHVSLFVSFHDALKAGEHELLNHRCLDFYKTACWSLYKQLKQAGLEIRYTPDQVIPTRPLETETHYTEYALSVSKWQSERDLGDYVQWRDASLVCISSLTSTDTLSELLTETNRSVTIALVPLSKAIPLPKGIQWLRWLWIEEEKDPQHKEQVKWFFSSLRKQVTANEQKLLSLLEKSGVKMIVLSSS